LSQPAAIARVPGAPGDNVVILSAGGCGHSPIDAPHKKRAKFETLHGERSAATAERKIKRAGPRVVTGPEIKKPRPGLSSPRGRPELDTHVGKTAYEAGRELNVINLSTRSSGHPDHAVGAHVVCVGADDHYPASGCADR